MPNRRCSWRVVVLAPLLAAALGACGGPSGQPVPAGGKQVSGSVVLPPGHAVDVSRLEVVTPFGTYPLGADGSFSVTVLDGADTELGVELPGGELLLLGVSDGDDARLSAASTAEALLYYLIGGMWLPPEHQDTVRELLRGRGEAGAIAGHLERLMLAGGNGLAAPDEALEDALEAARASLLADVELRAAAVPPAMCPALLAPAAAKQSVIIHDGTTEQAGAMLLHHPGGLGVAALNSLRRPGALLAYEVEWEDHDDNVFAVEPPVEVGRVDVPSTDNLELFAALADVFTGDAPWRPVLSPALLLPGRDGAALTRYEVVLVAPSLSGETLPIWDDPRFLSLRDEWEEIRFEKNLELFLDELLVPLLEVYALGQVAKVSSARLGQFRAGLKEVYDEHLLGLGVYLKDYSWGGYASGMKFVLHELAVNRTLRSDMIEMITEALELSDRRKLVAEAMDARLAARARAAAIAFAVQTVLVSGDAAKVVADVASAPAVAGWSVEAMPATYYLDPPVGLLTKDNASAVFRVLPVGDPPLGYFRFRWSTSGLHGVVDDLMGGEGLSIDTTAFEVRYFHEDPAVLSSDHVDTVMVEVFLFADPVEAIPDDARPIGKGQAVVRGRGEDRPECVWECDDDGICTIRCD